MKKYFAVAKITMANYLEYRWEYIIGQFRAILLLITLYFLWTKVFGQNLTLFSYNRHQIITYIILAAILRQFVITSSTEQIAGELQSWGKFFSYLLKPIGYFRYWFSVDLIYKLTNIIFISIVAFILIIFLKISFVYPPHFTSFLMFTISTILAVLIYFYIGILISSTGFWTSQVWGLQFLMVLVLEFAAGAYFPIDVLPLSIQSVIKLTPFPYLLYFPINIFLGRLTFLESTRVVMVSAVWLVIIYSLTTFVWRKGLKAYEAWGG